MLILFLAATAVVAQGIPEPDLLLYGVIKNVNSNANLRIGYGTLKWTFQPSGGGSPLTFTTTLTNLNDQFSYVLRVPCETPAAGFAASTNKLQLTTSGTSFSRAQVMWNSNLLAFVQPAQSNIFLRSSDRGQVERIDLNVSVPVVYDINGLPVDWELTYFGHTGVDPLADPDGDGLSNFSEFRTGTNPNDSLSNLRFTEISPVTGGIRVRWLSTPDKKYALQRAASPSGSYLDIQTGIPATAYLNTLVDTNATGPGPYMYRLRMDDIYSAATSSGFKVVRVMKDPLGGLTVEWESAAGKQYTVQRSGTVAAGYVDVATAIGATAPLNSYRDASAIGAGPYFYRLRLDSGAMSVPVALSAVAIEPERITIDQRTIKKLAVPPTLVGPEATSAKMLSDGGKQ